MSWYSYLRESNSNLVRVDELCCWLHNTAEKSTSTLSSSAAHHISWSSHHVNEEADDEKRRKKSTQASRFNFGLVDDGDVVDWLDIKLRLSVFEISFERIDGSDVEPENTVRNVAGRKFYAYPFLVDNFELFNDAAGEVTEILLVRVVIKMKQLRTYLFTKSFHEISL